MAYLITPLQFLIPRAALSASTASATCHRRVSALLSRDVTFVGLEPRGRFGLREDLRRVVAMMVTLHETPGFATTLQEIAGAAKESGDGRRITSHKGTTPATGAFP